MEQAHGGQEAEERDGAGMEEADGTTEAGAGDMVPGGSSMVLIRVTVMSITMNHATIRGLKSGNF